MRGAGGSGPQHLFLKKKRVCGSFLLYCFSKNYLCGFRVCFHSGWDGKGSDLSATLLSPKVYATGGKLGFCIFPFSLGCSLLPCESAFSWGGPSQTLQSLALLDKEQLFGLGGSDRAPSRWYVELLFSGPTVAFNSDILTIRISRSVPVSLGCFPLHFNCKPPTGPVPWIPMHGWPSRGGTPRLHTATKIGAGSLCEPYKTLGHNLPGCPQPATTAVPL